MAVKFPGRKSSGGAGQQPAKHEPAACPGSQAGQLHPGLYQKKQSSRSRISSFDETVPQILHSDSEFLEHV